MQLLNMRKEGALHSENLFIDPISVCLIISSFMQCKAALIQRAWEEGGEDADIHIWEV